VVDAWTKIKKEVGDLERDNNDLKVRVWRGFARDA